MLIICLVHCLFNAACPGTNICCLSCHYDIMCFVLCCAISIVVLTAWLSLKHQEDVSRNKRRRKGTKLSLMIWKQLQWALACASRVGGWQGGSNNAMKAQRSMTHCLHSDCKQWWWLLTFQAKAKSACSTTTFKLEWCEKWFNLETWTKDSGLLTLHTVLGLSHVCG